MTANESWSEDDIRELINEFRRRPILWDENCDDFKDKHKKITVWKELAHIFNTTVADIQRRTNNLKNSFFDEDKKMKKMKAARRKTYVPWEHYGDLKFLIGETVEGSTSESDAASTKDDGEENFIPMEVEPGGLSSRVTRSTLHAEPKSMDPPSATATPSLSASFRPVTRPSLTATRSASSRRSMLAGLPTTVTSVVTTTKKRILSETISTDDEEEEKSRTSPLKTSPSFSPTINKLAYYPQLSGLSNSSISKRSSLYPSLGSETATRYSPTKITASHSEISTRHSPETDRATKRRKVSDGDEAPFNLSPSPNRPSKVLVRDSTNVNDAATDNGSSVSQVLTDDYDLFGAFVASEIRSLKLRPSKIKLKGMIQRSIAQVAEEDGRLSGQ